jgi:threonine aldolase
MFFPSLSTLSAPASARASVSTTICVLNVVWDARVKLNRVSGAPIGSCLIGSKEFINRARRFRKAFGGGMRQTGFLAASAAFALTHNFPKLAAVHKLARRLESGLLGLGVEVTGSAETCMVRFAFSTSNHLGW